MVINYLLLCYFCYSELGTMVGAPLRTRTTQKRCTLIAWDFEYNISTLSILQKLFCVMYVCRYLL